MKNYTLIKEMFVEEVHSEVKLYKHNKSGARVLTFKNDDNNKVFTVGFRTPPKDSTGVPHILEHSTLCGSKKFPVKDPFVELAKGSLNTFLNAMTFADKTLYPVASCNDKDFQNLMEVYLDAVFYPNVYIHEEIFKQEGWHYELESIDSELKYNGVVYNEMKGVFSSPESIVGRESMDILFPDTIYGVESGGDPDYIPNLTYEQFKNFHSKFYSPANSYIVLYGDMNMDEKMEFIDKEYLSNFDYIETDSNIEYQKPFDKPYIKEIKYPVSKDSSLDGKTYYSYNAVIGDYKDTKTAYAFGVLQYVLLDMPGAILKQALLDKNIGKDIFGSYSDGTLQPTFGLIAKDAKENMTQDFINTIEDALKDLVKNGIDKKALLSALNVIEFRNREGDFGRYPKGLFYIIDSFSTWLYDDNNPIERLEYEKIFKELKEDIKTDYFEKLIEKYLINNNHKAFLVASPSKDIADIKEKELKEKLEKYKNSLSKEELEKLVQDTKDLKKYQETPSTKEELSTVPRLKREDISTKIDDYSNEVDVINDVKCINHNYETNGIGYLTLLFDASHIENERIPYINILTSMLGQVDTKNYKYQDLNIDININTGGIEVDTFPISINNSAKCFVSFDSKYLFGKEQYVFDIIKEIITNTVYENKTRIKEIIMEMKSSLEMSIMGSGHAVSFQRALSYIKPLYFYRDSLKGISEYQIIKDIEKNFDSKIDSLIEILNNLTKEIFRKENMIVSYTANNRDYQKCINSFSESLFNGEITKHEFKFERHILNEAFKTPGQVQFVSKVGYKENYKPNGVLPAFIQSLSYDYLWTKVRVLGGAYGAMTNVTRDGDVFFTSYRDPHLKNTLDVYNGTLEFIDSFNPTEDEITNFIVGACGNMDAPMSPNQKGQVSLNAYLRGTNIEDIRRERIELINAKVEDFKKLKEIYIDAFKENVICVVGNEKKIEENKELFDNIVDLFA